MNKSELRKYIIWEVKRLIQKGQMDMVVLGGAILDLEQLADNIISKIPEPVITSPITEADIVEVLEKYNAHYVLPAAWLFFDETETIPIHKVDHEEIAKEILGKGESTSQK